MGSKNRILSEYSNLKGMGLLIGPLLFVLFNSDIIPLEGLSEEGRGVLATAVWMGVWWITEALPIAGTALLPIVLLPLNGSAPIAQTTAAYGDKMLFLFLGGFVIAIAMQKWNLHRRIALQIIHRVGTRTDTIILGFMLASGLLSMWISNTATTLMMVTIAVALIAQFSEGGVTGEMNSFFKALLLGIAFSSSIGGVATLVGTPTNPIFVALSMELFEQDFSFVRWMSFALPFSLFMLGFSWWVLTRVTFKCRKIKLPTGRELIHQELVRLGPMKFEEKLVLAVFLLTALAWISRSFILIHLVPNIDDTIIAIGAAALLFILPASKGGRILDWKEAENLPWGVIILFGGGLSLAAAFRSSGLAEWLGAQLSATGELPLLAIILVVTLTVNFLTEVTSNVATASIFLPVLAALAEVIGVHPYTLMIPATMAASCAFMLPVATAPNAIIFGAGHLSIRDMVRAGFALNLVSSVLIALLIYFFQPGF